MNKWLLIILLYCMPIQSYACDAQCPVTPDNAWNYYANDHFRWTDPDQQVHMLIGFGGTLVVSEFLTRYAGLKPWQSALLGAVTLTLVGVTKEIMFDTYASRSDIKGWAGGAAVGGLTFTVLHF